MGHIRLGTLPRTRKWNQVLDLIGDGAGTVHIAAATMEASQRGLKNASNDPGLIHSFWLLTQLPLAARNKSFLSRLNNLGIQVSDPSSLYGIVGAFSSAVDEHLHRNGGRTDLGEMAQMAACESLTALGSPATADLFGTTAADVQQAIKELATPKQFSALATDFFARLSRKYLTYFLSRVLSNYVGENSRFSNIDRHIEFNQGLDLHCRQASRIIMEFAGGWFSKTNFEGEITPAKASEFVYVALKKLRAELAKGQDDYEP